MNTDIPGITVPERDLIAFTEFCNKTTARYELSKEKVKELGGEGSHNKMLATVDGTTESSDKYRM